MDYETDIKTDITIELQKTSLLNYPLDMKGIDKVLSLRGRELSTLSEDKLSEYVFIVTQYQLFLQLHHNIRNIEFLALESKYERTLNSALLKVDDKGKKLTVKEKTALAIENNDELKELEDKMLRAKCRHVLLNNVPDSFIEFGNAIKKELSIRVSKKDIGYRRS